MGNLELKRCVLKCFQKDLTEGLFLMQRGRGKEFQTDGENG